MVQQTNTFTNDNYLYLGDEEQTIKSTEKIKGEYENRIRIFSPIQKKYVIFGKIKRTEDQMSIFQMFDSLLPYQGIKTYKEEDFRNFFGHNSEAMSILSKADVNGDKKICIEEYMIMCFLCSEHINQFKHLADKYNKVKISDLEDFVMEHIVERSNLKKNSRVKIDGRLASTDKVKLAECIKEFWKNCYGGKEVIDFKELFHLKYELFFLVEFTEFYRIRGSQETNLITMEQFAKVFISYINIYKNKIIYDRLAKKEFSLEGTISFNEFISFYWFVSEFSQLKPTLKEKSISKKELIKFANQIVDTLPDKSKRVKLGEKHINLIYEILDEDKNGLLDISEIDGILKKRNFFPSQENEYSEVHESFKAVLNRGFSFLWSNLSVIKH